MAAWAARATKRVGTVQAISLVALALAGVAAAATLGFGAISRLPSLVSQAVGNARLRRPPTYFDPGWRVILVWTLALVGYAGTWIATEFRRPALGLLVPMPIVAFAAIAQPPEAQVAGGVVAVATFVVALAVIFRADRGDEGRMPVSFELRRATKAAPLVLALIAGMIGLSRADLLFPKPLYDPTQKAVLPKAIPLSDVRDRVLMTVESSSTGPWRTGVLDVYDGRAWRLPPYASSSLHPVPRSGVLDASFEATGKARITIEGLEGTVLPMPTRPVGLVFTGPKLVTEARTGTVRVSTGQIQRGFAYDATFASLPSEDQLRAAPAPGSDLAPYLDAPAPPDAVAALLRQAPKAGWDRLQFVREKLLDSVVASGSGLPVEVPPGRVQQMLSGHKEATPFEIVAAQALLARWAGVPARIGYGFDGGEVRSTGVREIRPKNGSLWLEVYFRGFGWLPITGLPKIAKQTLGGKATTVEAELIPGSQIGVELFVPLKSTPPQLLFKRVRTVALLVLALAALIALAWTLWPVIYKARRRARRRGWALRTGSVARVAAAYAELRDLATDLGIGDAGATPFAFLERVVPDEEHTELAWLVTRALWGDLARGLTDDDVYAAEEMSRSLRRRLFEAQPVAIRVISIVSRLSIKHPFAPELLAAGVPEPAVHEPTLVAVSPGVS
jgi:hypothetical protein